MKASNTPFTVSIRVRHLIKIHCNWPSFYCSITATGLCWSDRITYILTNRDRVMADLIAQAKGKVLDELYVPLDAKAKDFDKPISKIASLKPDVVFSTVVGLNRRPSSTRLTGAPGRSEPNADCQLDDERSRGRGDVARGRGRPHHGRTFFEALATSAARRFISAYKLRYGPNAPVPPAPSSLFSSAPPPARCRPRWQPPSGTAVAGVARCRIRCATRARSHRRQQQSHLPLAARGKSSMPAEHSTLSGTPASA